MANWLKRLTGGKGHAVVQPVEDAPVPLPAPVRRHEKTAKICGHPTKLKGEVMAFGETITTEMKPNEDGEIPFCLDCIAGMAIQCTLCGKPIFIGDPLTLFKFRDPDHPVPDYAVTYNDEKLIGCLRDTCCDTIAERSGFWIPDEESRTGSVRRVASPFAQAMQGQTGIIEDVNRP